MVMVGEGKARTWSIAGGFFEMKVPASWRYEPQGYFEGAFHLPNGLELACEVDSFEDRDVVQSQDFSDYINEPGIKQSRYHGSEALENFFMQTRMTEDESAHEFIFKSLETLGADFLRRIRLSLQFPASTSPLEHREVIKSIAVAIGSGKFAKESTPLDRIAPKRGSKRITAGNVVHIRVPETWNFEITEDGRYVCDEDEPLDVTLWIDWDLFALSADSPGTREDARGLAMEGAQEMLHSRPGLVGKPVIEETDEGVWCMEERRTEEKDEITRILAFRRYRAEARSLLLTHFNLVLLESQRASSRAADCIALVEHEVRNAVLWPEGAIRK